MERDIEFMNRFENVVKLYQSVLDDAYLNLSTGHQEKLEGLREWIRTNIKIYVWNLNNEY